MNFEKVSKIIDQISKSENRSYDEQKVNQLIPKAMAKAEVLSKEEIEKFKADLGQERVNEICKILSEIK